jgi:hypothetical protein
MEQPNAMEYGSQKVSSNVLKPHNIYKYKETWRKKSISELFQTPESDIMLPVIKLRLHGVKPKLW